MAYIGAQPRLGNFQACDAITTSATTTFNLLVGGTAIFPQTAQHCLVSLNGVLQAPISSYTISGSTIIFAAALTTDDSIDFITILGDTLDLGTPSDSTVTTAKLNTALLTGATDIGAAIADADLFLVDDGAGGTLRKSAASRLKTYITDNTPAFQAERNGTQAIANNTETKIVCNNEIFDTDNAFASGRFTPQTAGKYLINGGFRLSSYTAGRAVSWIRKNGNEDHAVNEHYGDSSGSTQSALSTAIIPFNGSDDYVELYCFQNSGSSKNVQEDRATFFGGFKLIGV